MTTKTHLLTAIGAIVFITSILSSCATSNNLTSGNSLQKRKHYKGWSASTSQKKQKTEVRSENSSYLAETTKEEVQEDKRIEINIDLKHESDNLLASSDNFITPSQDNSNSMFQNNEKKQEKAYIGPVENEDKKCDHITLKTGEEIEAKILEINETHVKYKKCSNLEGPTYIKRKSDILLIKYPDGTKDIFANENNNRQENNNLQENNQAHHQNVNNEKRSIAAWGVVGTIFGIFIPLAGWILGGIGLIIYSANSERYTESSKGWAIAALAISTLAFFIYLTILTQ